VLVEALQQASAALDMRAERAEAAHLVAQLTEREREVLDMVGRGWSTREIAESLHLSPRTVDTHRANIAQKLGTTSVAEFARLSLIGRAP
jgi:DNA-binding NarL/FixJ family response regulator